MKILRRIWSFLFEPWRLVDAREAADEDWILTIRKGDHEMQARGSCTVWHWYPDGRRCHSGWEWFFCDCWTRVTWDKADRSRGGKS